MGGLLFIAAFRDPPRQNRSAARFAISATGWETAGVARSGIGLSPAYERRLLLVSENATVDEADRNDAK